MIQCFKIQDYFYFLEDFKMDNYMLILDLIKKNKNLNSLINVILIYKEKLIFLLILMKIKLKLVHIKKMRIVLIFVLVYQCLINIYNKYIQVFMHSLQSLHNLIQNYIHLIFKLIQKIQVYKLCHKKLMINFQNYLVIFYS